MMMMIMSTPVVVDIIIIDLYQLNYEWSVGLLIFLVCLPSKKKKKKTGKTGELENIEDKDDGRDTLEPLPPQPGPPGKSGLSSGMTTPDKPVTYCVEGTPVSLSRFSSISSLTSGEINANNTR